MPTIYQYRAFAAAGGLLSYGGSSTEPFRQVGIYTGRVLKGEKPAELPIQQSSKVELIINLKTAKATRAYYSNANHWACRSKQSNKCPPSWVKRTSALCAAHVR